MRTEFTRKMKDSIAIDAKWSTFGTNYLCSRFAVVMVTTLRLLIKCNRYVIATRDWKGNELVPCLQLREPIVSTRDARHAHLEVNKVQQASTTLRVFEDSPGNCDVPLLISSEQEQLLQCLLWLQLTKLQKGHPVTIMLK